MKKIISAIAMSVLASLSLAGAGGAITDQTTAKETTEKSQLPPEAAPTTFLRKAAASGMAEVELGKVAEQRSSNAAVKAFGKQMVTDHSAANAEVQKLASEKQIPLPTQLDDKDVAMRDKLAKLSGTDFDRAYMADMSSDHDKAVEHFRQASVSSTDKDVKAFAEKTLPILEGHLKKANEVQASLGQASAN